MLLVIDAGNTETVFGLFEGKILKDSWRLSSRFQRTPDEGWLLLKLWLDTKGYKIDDVRGVVISSVVPQLTSVFEKIFRSYFKLEPVVVNNKIKTGLTYDVEAPHTIGADRICNAAAGFIKFGGPVIVVDFGTATAFDVVSEKGEFLGGTILLGIKGAAQELSRIAAKLFKVDLVFPDRIVGKNTETNIQSGLMWGTLFAVDQIIEGINKEMQWSNTRVISTGGLAEMISSKSKIIQKVEPLLTLDGMRLIYEMNHAS